MTIRPSPFIFLLTMLALTLPVHADQVASPSFAVRRMLPVGGNARSHQEETTPTPTPVPTSTPVPTPEPTQVPLMSVQDPPRTAVAFNLPSAEKILQRIFSKPLKPAKVVAPPAAAPIEAFPSDQLTASPLYAAGSFDPQTTKKIYLASAFLSCMGILFLGR